MKLAQTILTKHTARLFNKKYKYKAVIVMKGCGWFRGGDLDTVKRNIDTFDPANQPGWSQKLMPEDLAFIKKFYNVIKKASDYEIRVESPLVSLYTNNESLIETVSAIRPDLTKYVSFPKPGSEQILDNQGVITKRLDYGFKVTMGRTRKSFPDFLTWAKDMTKVRLTKRTIKELAKDHSWGGYYFYVKDDKTLTMVKIFLGNYIQTVEKVIKT